MKKDKTLDFSQYQARQFHVYAILLTRDAIFYNEGNKKPLKRSDYLHTPSLKTFLNSLYESMGIPEPKINECFGLSVQQGCKMGSKTDLNKSAGIRTK